MDLSNLYNVAFDMLSKKKSNGFNFSDNNGSTITVISAQNGSIFKGNNGHKIVDGKLINTCSEIEAISSMIKEKQSKIDTMITLNIENGDFIMPCETCIDLILQINKDNINCKIMTNINESIPLSSIVSKDLKELSVEKSIDNHSTDTTSTNDNVTDTSTSVNPLDMVEDWDDGWDFDDDTENDNTSTKVEKNSINDDINNPMPNTPTSIGKENSINTYYQSRYINSTPTPVDSSISVSPITSQNSKPFRHSNTISDIMKKNGLSESDKKDFNKQRLFNAFTTDTVASTDNNIGTSAEKQNLSKKELMKLAKEKKKMAKKDAKILKATEKKNNS